LGRFLLDTHVFLQLAKDRRLSAAAERALGDPDSKVFLSVVTVAEACIKAALGKLVLPREIQPDAARGFRAACASADIDWLPIEVEHAARLRTLPRHHKDPFDRLLIAQALEEGLVLVSGDAAFSRYEGLALLHP
jgi:PIN domain nuclease of toxin-antitoxin system